MFDVEKLLGQMLSGGMGGGKRERRSASTFGLPGVSKAQLGVGAIGIAIAAWEHYKSKSGAPSAEPRPPAGCPEGGPAPGGSHAPPAAPTADEAPAGRAIFSHAGTSACGRRGGRGRG